MKSSPLSKKQKNESCVIFISEYLMSLLTRVLLFTYNCYHIIVIIIIAIIIIAIPFTIIEKLNLKLPIMFRYSDFFLTFFF